jgi:NADH dehydrogenase FAD-containing subunit
LRKHVEDELEKQKIKVETKCDIAEITADKVICRDGREFE